jgi:hypothetical protein
MLICCQNKSKRLVDSLNQCSFNDFYGNFEKELYPFDINKFDENLISANCYKGVVIDSIVRFAKDSGFNRIFFLTDKTSIIKWNPISSGNKNQKNVFLTDYSITTNLIRYKNGIRIGMLRHDFFDKIKRHYSDCNTFTIDMVLCNYYFIFRNDSLVRIERKIVAM